MATKDVRQHTTLGTRLRFLVRVLGLTSVLAVTAGAVLASTVQIEPSIWTLHGFESALKGEHGEFARDATWILAIGAGATALALLAEVAWLFLLGAGRRTAAGTSATVAA